MKLILISITIFTTIFNMLKFYWLSKLKNHKNLHKATKYLNIINLGFVPIGYFVLMSLFSKDAHSALLHPSTFGIYLPLFIIIYILNFMSFTEFISN